MGIIWQYLDKRETFQHIPLILRQLFPCGLEPPHELHGFPVPLPQDADLIHPFRHPVLCRMGVVRMRHPVKLRAADAAHFFMHRFYLVFAGAKESCGGFLYAVSPANKCQ